MAKKKRQPSHSIYGKRVFGGLGKIGGTGPTRQAAKGFNKGVAQVNQAAAAKQPPYGTYDPSLDQQLRAAGRGLGDLINTARQTNSRNTQDLNIGLSNITNAQGTGAYDTSLADLLTARQRGQQDYQTATQDRQRQYGILANHQAEQAAAAGVLGGAIQQAAQKRAANQDREQGLADQAYQRFVTDSNTDQTRLGNTRDQGEAALRLTAQRQFEDLYDPETGKVTLAQRELPIFAQDTNELRIAQAKQAGLLPPVPTIRKIPVPKARRGRGRARNVGGNRSQGTGRI